jgi:hypothetical protein
LKMPDGRMECVPFPRGWTADQLRTAVSNRGLEGGTPVEIYFDDDEDATDQETPYIREVRKLLSAVFGQFSAQSYGGSGERTQNRLAVVQGINLLYIRAIAKVAFHYFLWACRTLRGDEPAFAPLRAFIKDGVGNWRDFVELGTRQFLPILRSGAVPVRTSHFFNAALTREEASARIQFFVGPQALPKPSRVKLATNPLRIDGKDFACHQACHFDGDEQNDEGHDGELIAIDVFERKIITPR